MIIHDDNIVTVRKKIIEMLQNLFYENLTGI